MKTIMFLGSALSLGVGAAYADNEGIANTRYPQIILEAAPTSLTPVAPVVPRAKGWQQDGPLILLH